METKQVLVWNKSLRNKSGQKVRTGKIAAQLAHASMAAILNEGEFDWPYQGTNTFTLHVPRELKSWYQDSFTKICVGVDGEGELLNIYGKAERAGIVCSLIQDNGLTEFDGVPTHTAVAIGPGLSEEIDKITGHLKLL